MDTNGNKPHDDKTEILSQTRALTSNPEQFYREIIFALAHSLTLEEFHTVQFYLRARLR